MKKIFTAAFLLVSMSIAAQETYQNAELMTEDLNGTARYVGMGGALDALGADLSVAGTNPAGVGLFRRSTANVSFGLANQKNGGNDIGTDKTNVNFDQVGFVVTMPSYDRRSFVNFAVNYHKSSNFNQILSAIGRLNNETSQNKVSFMKQDDGTVGTYEDKKGYICVDNDAGSQVDYLYYNTLLLTFDGDNYFFDYNDASKYQLERNRKGYIGEYDFNLSGNVNDRFFWGLTFGIKDVHYKNFTNYTDHLVSGPQNDPCGTAVLDDVRSITGTGYNAKFGVIVRPVEASPLRVGISVATPTWYDLTTSNYTKLDNNTRFGDFESCDINEAYDYKMTTPWQFGLSVGTTVGNQLALGASYDFSDYSSSQSRIKGDEYYDYWTDSYRTESSKDLIMNRHTEKTLRGVSTFKAGMEFKPIPEVALRLGYNYVSPMYKKEGYRDLSLNSPGTYYSSTTDFTNWQSTNRFTCGLGYIIDDFTLDLAYQYSKTNGNFEPFYYKNCGTEKLDVNNTRHQFICTLGYRF